MANIEAQASRSPWRIRTRDLRLRRRQRPATTNAGRCCFKHLRGLRASQRRLATPPLLPPLLPRVASPSVCWSSAPPYVHQELASERSKRQVALVSYRVLQSLSMQLRRVSAALILFAQLHQLGAPLACPRAGRAHETCATSSSQTAVTARHGASHAAPCTAAALCGVVAAAVVRAALFALASSAADAVPSWAVAGMHASDPAPPLPPPPQA